VQSGLGSERLGLLIFIFRSWTAKKLQMQVGQLVLVMSFIVFIVLLEGNNSSYEKCSHDNYVTEKSRLDTI